MGSLFGSVNLELLPHLESDQFQLRWEACLSSMIVVGP